MMGFNFPRFLIFPQWRIFEYFPIFNILIGIFFSLLIDFCMKLDDGFKIIKSWKRWFYLLKCSCYFAVAKLKERLSNIKQSWKSNSIFVISYQKMYGAFLNFPSWWNFFPLQAVKLGPNYEDLLRFLRFYCVK